VLPQSISVNNDIHGVLQTIFHGIAALCIIEYNISPHIRIQGINILDLLYLVRIVHGYMLLYGQIVGHQIWWGGLQSRFPHPFIREMWLNEKRHQFLVVGDEF
jgi:hypothetical protein